MERVSGPTRRLVPPQRAAAAASRSVEPALRAGVSRANADYALRYLLRADPRIAATAQKLLAKLPEKKLPGNLLDAKAMTAWAKKEFEAANPKLASAVELYLSTHLYSMRLDERVEWRFGLREVDLDRVTAPPAHGAVFNTTDVAKDYHADRNDHSFKDVQSYVNEWLPSFAIADLEKSDAELWVMEGTRDGALARARADGFTEAFRIETPGAFGQNELYLASDPVSGRKRYFFAEVQGDSAIATLLRVAGLSGAGGAAPVKLVSDISTRRSAQLISAYESLRPYAGAEAAIIGFKNTVRDELWQRKVLGDAAPRITRWAGVPPMPIDGLPTHGQLRVLGTLLAKVVASENAPPEAKALYAQLDRSAELLAPPKQDPLGATAWDGGMIRTRTNTGAQSTLALLRTPYGDTAGPFVSALSELGMKKVAVIGTAGGLASNSKVGDIVVPTSVSGPLGDSQTFENAAAPFLSDGPGSHIRESANAATIATPLHETNGAIAQMQARGDDAVELELASIVGASRGVDLSAAFVVSDVPGSHETIESQAPHVLDDSVGEVLDGLLRSLGIADVELPGHVAGRPFPKNAAEALTTLADDAGMKGAERAKFVERWTKAWGAEPFSELDVPYEVILRHGHELATAVMSAFALADLDHGLELEVPGLDGVKRIPERMLTGEATSFDALALELDERVRRLESGQK